MSDPFALLPLKGADDVLERSRSDQSMIISDQLLNQPLAFTPQSPSTSPPPLLFPTSNPPAPFGTLTCEALREELRYFAQEGALHQELGDVKARIRTELHNEMRKVLEELHVVAEANSEIRNSYSFVEDKEELEELESEPEIETAEGSADKPTMKRSISKALGTTPAAITPAPSRSENFNFRGYFAMNEIKQHERDEQDERQSVQTSQRRSLDRDDGNAVKKVLSSKAHLLPSKQISFHEKTSGKAWKPIAGSGGAGLLNSPSFTSDNPGHEPPGVVASPEASKGTSEVVTVQSDQSVSDMSSVIPVERQTSEAGREEVENGFSADFRDSGRSSSSYASKLAASEEGDTSDYGFLPGLGLGKSDSDNKAPSTLGSWCPRLRQFAQRIVRADSFDYIIGIFILANAVQIGVQTDDAARNRSDDYDTPMVFRVLEIIFCAVFTSELSLRLLSEGATFFYAKGWQWNQFDMFVVCLQLFEETMALIQKFLTATNGEDSMNLNLSFLRVLRIMRLVRIIRLVRILRLIGELRTLVMSIICSLRSLGWTMVLMFVMIYSFSVYFTQLVADHDGSSHPDLYRVYGSLDLTILNLFGAITGGLDWRDALEPLIQSISPLVAIIFCFYIAFSVLAVMNVVTGVFVESALLSAKADQDIFMVSNLKDMFQSITGDKAENAHMKASDLAMTWEDFRNRIHTRQMQDYFKSIDVDPGDAWGIFQLIDQENRGFVTFEEFVTGCCRLRGPAKAIDHHILLFELKAFKKQMEGLHSSLDTEVTGLGKMVGRMSAVGRAVRRGGGGNTSPGRKNSVLSAVPRNSDVSQQTQQTMQSIVTVNTQASSPRRLVSRQRSGSYSMDGITEEDSDLGSVPVTSYSPKRETLNKSEEPKPIVGLPVPSREVKESSAPIGNNELQSSSTRSTHSSKNSLSNSQS